MEWTPTREAGLARLEEFLPRAGRDYAQDRNHDKGTERTNVSQLSPWLHAGLLSESEVLETVLSKHSASAADKFISEVFWRIYFKGYLEQRPTIWRACCDGRDKALGELAGNTGLQTAYSEAIEGRTGIAAFDHWARELTQTGYLHNHARMWFASIWIFTLRLDWQLGADFFLRHLMDGDAASNTLSWRWVAGLHTKGKTYLARASNIERFTAEHPEGPLSAAGLAHAAAALTEDAEHGRQPLDLPPAPPSEAFDVPFALLLHDEAASHVPLGLPAAPAFIITAARPDARSPGDIGTKARDFALEAVEGGGDAAAGAFDCLQRDWTKDTKLADLLSEAGIERLAVPYLPIGWTRDALWPELAPLEEDGRLVTMLADLDRATWPFAKAGFFGVKKKMEGAMREAGIAGV